MTAETCRFCGKTYEMHLDVRPPGSPIPRMPCLGLKAHFLARKLIRPVPEAQVHLVQIWLCEFCLQGVGAECHTPGCALFLHDSPGYPITRELYEIVEPKT